MIVAENMFGDILSDLAAATVGGLGMAPSGDIGDHHALFQPSHGTAPDIAGKGIANPLATILSAGLMLDWLGERDGNDDAATAAARIEAAVSAVTRRRPRPHARSRRPGTTAEVGDAVLAALATPPGLTERPRMRAMVIHRHGGPEVLTLEPNWPDPVAGPGEIVVRVHALRAQSPRHLHARGHARRADAAPPHHRRRHRRTVATGRARRESPRVGDRVVLNPSWGCGVCEYCRDGEVPKCIRVHMLGEMDPGGLAELVKCPARQAIALPDSYPFEEAACLPITFGTAWRMLVTHARVQPGEDVLVHGAVGGVGLAAIQIAKLAGARVFATASTSEKLERATAARRRRRDQLRRRQGLGRDRAPPHRQARRRRDRRDRGRRDVGALDPRTRQGRPARHGGATSGPIGPTDIRYLFRREHTIQGSNGWTHNDLLTIVRLAFAGKLRPVIDRVLPLERAAEGERAMERREVIGKVVIRP